MKMVTDSELLSLCFGALVDRVGYVDTERFIVMMNRAPEDYTKWRRMQPESSMSIEELGEDIMEFARAKKKCAYQIA